LRLDKLFVVRAGCLARSHGDLVSSTNEGGAALLFAAEIHIICCVACHFCAGRTIRYLDLRVKRAGNRVVLLGSSRNELHSALCFAAAILIILLEGACVAITEFRWLHNCAGFASCHEVFLASSCNVLGIALCRTQTAGRSIRVTASASCAEISTLHILHVRGAFLQAAGCSFRILPISVAPCLGRFAAGVRIARAGALDPSMDVFVFFGARS
jgi:hypothetical protein